MPPRTVELLSARGGVHVPGARLWLNGDTRRGVGFLQAYDGRPHKTARLLCSRVVATLLQSRSTTPLTPPMGKPFQLARLAMELLPAGSSPGSALLRLHHGGQVLLFAAAGRLDALPTATPLELREADVIAVDARLAEVELSSVAQLAAFVDDAVALVQAGARLAVRFDEASVALDVLKLAGDRVPVALTPKLRRLAGRYASAGIVLPDLVRAAARPGRPVLVLEGAEAEGPGPVDVRWLVAEGVDSDRLAASHAERGLAFARQASGRGLDALVRASGVRRVLAFGTGAEVLCARLRAQGLDCENISANVQLSLV